MEHWEELAKLLLSEIGRQKKTVRYRPILINCFSDLLNDRNLKGNSAKQLIETIDKIGYGDSAINIIIDAIKDQTVEAEIRQQCAFVLAKNQNPKGFALLLNFIKQEHNEKLYMPAIQGALEAGKQEQIVLEYIDKLSKQGGKSRIDREKLPQLTKLTTESAKKLLKEMKSHDKEYRRISKELINQTFKTAQSNNKVDIIKACLKEIEESNKALKSILTQLLDNFMMQDCVCTASTIIEVGIQNTNTIIVDISRHAILKALIHQYKQARFCLQAFLETESKLYPRLVSQTIRDIETRIDEDDKKDLYGNLIKYVGDGTKNTGEAIVQFFSKHDNGSKFLEQLITQNETFIIVRDTIEKMVDCSKDVQEWILNRAKTTKQEYWRCWFIGQCRLVSITDVQEFLREEVKESKISACREAAARVLGLQKELAQESVQCLVEQLQSETESEVKIAFIKSLKKHNVYSPIYDVLAHPDPDPTVNQAAKNEILALLPNIINNLSANDLEEQRNAVTAIYNISRAAYQLRASWSREENKEENEQIGIEIQEFLDDKVEIFKRKITPGYDNKKLLIEAIRWLDTEKARNILIEFRDNSRSLVIRRLSTEALEL